MGERLIYSEESIQEIESRYVDLVPRLNDIFLRTVEFSYKLTEPRAKEFMLHGVGRRLSILKRAFENIFAIFPARREILLSHEERTDTEINLHAFLINAYGIMENLALSLAYENGIYDGKINGDFDKRDIGLFSKKKFRKRLEPDLQAYLSDARLRLWFDDYAKNYRDALGHRIPPYIPPSGLNPADEKRHSDIQERLNRLDFLKDFSEYQALQDEQHSLGSAYPIYVHSFDEQSKPLQLRPQLIVDLLTIEEILSKVLEKFHISKEQRERSKKKPFWKRLWQKIRNLTSRST